MKNKEIRFEGFRGFRVFKSEINQFSGWKIILIVKISKKCRIYFFKKLVLRRKSNLKVHRLFES